MIQKIRNSLLLQFICIVLAILIVLTVTLYTSFIYVKDTTRNYAETLADSLLRQADNALGLYEESLKYNAESLCQFMIMDDLDTVKDDAGKAKLSSYYSQIAMRNREIVSAIILDSDLNTLVSMGKPAKLSDRQTYLRKEADLNADWYFPEDDNYYYGFFYPVYSGNGSNMKQQGMCVFILEPWRIDGTLHNILNDNMAAILLSDSHVLDLSFRVFGSVPADTTMADLKNNDDYVYREGNWQNGIRISVAVSVSGNTSGSSAIRNLIILASVLTLMFLGVILFFSYYLMARPIRAIDRFIAGSIKHPERRLNFKRTDEIGKVAARLDHMLDENQRMIEEIKEGKIRLYETKLAQQKMEILAYRNQINPHFLYNTLSTMRDMALINDQDSIAEMAMALSDIFRYAVKASNIVTVGDEVSYIAKYARIIEYRFMGKIKISTDVEDYVLDKPMIRFFLQPLVENSVFHGLESKMDNGSVEVKIESVDDRVEITIRDDGCGMDEETLNNLRSQLEEPKENSGIGLSNIVQRLRLFYGNDYTFDVKSRVNEGTVIHISVPDHITES
ncbi:MAG: sensor histidine kinase [Lachnospiraceae bacterium]|nr:sensor histidine kinase [Lachnospiraceae bacterium]